MDSHSGVNRGDKLVLGFQESPLIRLTAPVSCTGNVLHKGIMAIGDLIGRGIGKVGTYGHPNRRSHGNGPDSILTLF